MGGTLRTLDTRNFNNGQAKSTRRRPAQSMITQQNQAKWFNYCGQRQPELE